MSVFEILISPFLLIIEKLFFFSYKVSGNYGISIVLLSFLISLLLLPVFIFIEKAKKKDDAIKRKMQPFVDEIKRCYKGQEKFYYLKTLNRQYGYSQAHALIPILSLLLQIPFFIAAYQFLEGFEDLTGVGFLFIKDLSLPDGLLGSVNILPVAMTLVNLLTAYFYTKNGNTSERRQMLIVAGVFLILLFKLPSGLVLYWTMNNVFSFLRLFITNPEVFKVATRKVKGKTRFSEELKQKVTTYKSLFYRVFIVGTLVILASQLNWAFNNYFDDFAIRLIASPLSGIIIALIVVLSAELKRILSPIIQNLQVKPIVYFGVLFLSFYFYFSGLWYFKEEYILFFKLAALAILFAEAIGLLYVYRLRNKVSRRLLFFSFSIISILLLVQLTNLIVLFSGEELSFSIFNNQIQVEQHSWRSLINGGLVLSAFCLPFYIYKIKLTFLIELKNQYILLCLSLLYFFGLIFFWNPFIIYASYPANFNFPAVNFFTNNYLSFLLCFGVGFIIYILAPRIVKQFLLVFYVSIAIIAFLYSSIVPLKYGTLQVNFFSEEEKLLAHWYYYFAEAILLFSVVYFAISIFQKKQSKHLVIAFVLFNVFLAGQSLYKVMDTGVFYKKKLNSSYSTERKTNEISFSKTNENILLFVIDGAQGWYMHDFVEEDSTLKDVYRGFVYYPNALAMSNYTYASMPSIMCGYDFSIDKMNGMENKTIIEKITDATEIFYKKIIDRGYRYTTTELKYSNIDHSKFENYLPKWDNEWSRRLNIGKPNEMWYTRLSENALFSSAPLFLKPVVYNNRKWIVKNNLDVNSSELYKYNFVRVLPKISNNLSNKKNFIFIHSLYTHTPWDVVSDEDGFVRDVSPYENQKSFTYYFAKWLKWMKENEVYNNTKIILVSDHGPSWWHYQKETDPGSAPIVWSDNENLFLDRFLHLNILMLVKDFDATEPLKEDWRLMSNADVYSITFDDNDPTKVDSTSRTISTYYTRWCTDLHTRIKYDSRANFKVTGNMFDMNNWEDIEK